MIELASKVRNVLGDGVQISYAANWSEHHDFVGIDAYFPLTSHLQNDDRTYSGKDIEEG